MLANFWRILTPTPFHFFIWKRLVHYCEKLMGVIVFAKVQGQVKFESPRTFRLCKYADLCKNYYSHWLFAVITFLQKFKILFIFNTFESSKYYDIKFLDGNVYYSPNCLGGNENSRSVMSTTPQFSLLSARELLKPTKSERKTKTALKPQNSLIAPSKVWMYMVCMYTIGPAILHNWACKTWNYTGCLIR